MLAQVDRLPLRLDASQRTRLRKSLADDTIALLREAVAVGFKDAGRLRSEPLLTPFRTNAAYQALLAALNSRATFLRHDERIDFVFQRRREDGESSSPIVPLSGWHGSCPLDHRRDQ